MPEQRVATQFLASEWGYVSARPYDDPFNALELDVLFTHESSQTWRVPTYWAGEQEWRVRFAPPLEGHYSYQTLSSDTTNDSLHDQRGALIAHAYTGKNHLLAHGPLRVAESKRTFAFADGTPFFWLGDTWWFSLAKRLVWPEEFQRIARDRQAKGFNVVQVVAGLYPDMPPFDPRGVNEAGFPWEKDYQRIHPSYFELADLRIQWLVRCDLLPCIVGSWGYYLKELGPSKMKQHWRNLIARWGAYPVVWCLAGELAMPYYLDEKFGTGDDPDLAQSWVEIGHYVRATDPYHRLVTVHPSSNNPGRQQVTDDSVMDFEMLQSGHDGYDSIQTMLGVLAQQRALAPTMPILVDEINYEEQVHNSHAEVQRLAFWTAFLSGSAGFTYGASGLWAFNSEAQPWGASPHGLTWSDMTWEEALVLPGGVQLGYAKQLLERYEWWRFESLQTCVSQLGDSSNYTGMFAAGIPGEVLIVYSLKPTFPWNKKRKIVSVLGAETSYHAFFWNPRKDQDHDLGTITSDAEGNWLVPFEPTLQDWVVVLEKIS